MSSTGQPAPPGWYQDPSGARRYWDGRRWGAYAAPQPPQDAVYPRAASAPHGTASTTAAVIAHVGGLFGIWVPLVVYLVTERSDRFNRGQAAEALNFQLTALIAVIAVIAGGSVLAVATLGLGLIAIVPVPAAGGVLHVVWCIKGAVVASRGEWWRYPISIRMVR